MEGLTERERHIIRKMAIRLDKGPVTKDAGQDMKQGQTGGMARAKACAALSLEHKPADRTILAPAENQLPIGVPINEWTPIGPAWLKPVLQGSGKVWQRAMTPVRCSCGYETERLTSQIRCGGTKSCGHDSESVFQRATNKYGRRRMKAEAKR